MLASQEPKYDVNSAGELINRHTRVPIPNDEPVFVFRAKDALAVRALTAYFASIENKAHAKAVAARIEAFKAFAQNHPERMKMPDTASTVRPVR